jgi:hypothetical protein
MEVKRNRKIIKSRSSISQDQDSLASEFVPKPDSQV